MPAGVPPTSTTGRVHARTAGVAPVDRRGEVGDRGERIGVDDGGQHDRTGVLVLDGREVFGNTRERGIVDSGRAPERHGRAGGIGHHDRRGIVAGQGIGVGPQDVKSHPPPCPRQSWPCWEPCRHPSRWWP